MALLIMVGGMACSVYFLTRAYISYPVSVDISVQQEKQLDFPAVTVCNMSPVKKSALQAATSKRRKKRAPPSGKFIPVCTIHLHLACY